MKLIERGKLFEWQTGREIYPQQTQDEEDAKNSNEDPAIKEIDADIDGKQLSKLAIKDFACSSTNIFLATGKIFSLISIENGEIIVGKVHRSGADESQSEMSHVGDPEDLFIRRIQKITKSSKISFQFMKLNSIQSHFISQISCGNNHAILLTSSGFVYSLGKNEHGQLGHSSQSEDLKEPTIIFQLLNLKVFMIACGKHHNLVIGTSRDTMASTFQIYSTENALFTTIDKNKTLVYGWGLNKHGQLGTGDDKDRPTPVLIEPVLDYNFKKVACGQYHSALLEENGNLFTFGNNEFG